MKYLKTYEKLNLKNEKEVFDYFMTHLKESITPWTYFVDFEKVKKNIHLIEKELNLLNILIGKNNIETELINLIIEYPKIRKVLPILLAIRNKKELIIVNNFEELTSTEQNKLFNPNEILTEELKKELLRFFRESGLKRLFQDKNIKNIVDYCFGIEVGMDTNARKNRIGKTMEQIIENIIKQFSEDHQLEYISQATQSKIKTKWNIDLISDKTNRNFDFAILNKAKNKLCVIETNFYGGGGSKLKATAGEYKSLHDFLSKQNIELIWVTDGPGWKTAEKPLSETFAHNDYLINLELIKNEVLKNILL